MKRLLILMALFTTLHAPALAAAGAPTNENALCIYNSNVSDSVEICGYYVLKRLGAKSLGLDIPDRNAVFNYEITNLEAFIWDVVKPFRNYAAGHPEITHVAIAKGVPYKIPVEGQLDFPTSYILSLDTDYDRYFSLAENSGGNYNAFFGKIPRINTGYSSSLTHFSPGGQSDPAMSNHRFVVTYLYSYTLQDVKAMIDRASAPAPDRSEAKWVLDASSEPGNFTLWQFTGAKDTLIAGTNIAQGNIVLDAGDAKPLVVDGEIVAYAGRGHYHPNYTNLWAAANPAVLAKVSNRAIMTTQESFNATTFTGNPEHSVNMANERQSKIADAFTAGAFGGTGYSSSFSGAIGYVSEPSNAISMFKQFFLAYSSGLTLGESFLSSVVDEGVSIAVGDPLMRITDSDKAANWALCSSGSECDSGNCDADIFGTRRCHRTADSCVDFALNDRGIAAGALAATIRETKNSGLTCVAAEKKSIFACSNGAWQRQADCSGMDECLFTQDGTPQRSAVCKTPNAAECADDSACGGGKCAIDLLGVKRCLASPGRCITGAGGAEAGAGVFACIDSAQKAQCLNSEWQKPVQCLEGCESGICGEDRGIIRFSLSRAQGQFLTLPVRPVSEKLDDIFREAADSTQVFMWKMGSGGKKSPVSFTYDELAKTWLPGSGAISPGEGFELSASGGAILDFEGEPFTGPVPAKIGGSISLIGVPFCGNRYDAASALSEIAAKNPACGLLVKGRGATSKWWSTKQGAAREGTMENFALTNINAYFVECETDVPEFTWTPSCLPQNTPLTPPAVTPPIITPPEVVAPPASVTPFVSLISPASGSEFEQSAPITIMANAGDAAGIGRVEFYTNNGIIGTDTVAPYSITWSSSTLSYYVLTAKAFSTNGASIESAPITVKIIPKVSTIRAASVPADDAGTFSRTPNTTPSNLVAITEMSLEPAKAYYYPNEGVIVHLRAWRKNAAAPGNPPEYKATKAQAWLRTVYGDEYGHSSVNNPENLQEAKITLGDPGQPAGDQINFKDVPPGNYLVVAQVEQLDGTPDPSMSDNIASIYITVAEKRFTVPEIPAPLAALLAIAVIFAASRAGRKRE